MFDHVTLVPAGAGSGKTHRIETELCDLVVSGTIQPERILAVTFTEAAAEELKNRLRTTLMAGGRVEDALALERAYVGTIHGLGLRLLTEHAFAAGRSPQSRLLTDAERDLLIRLELGRTAALRPVLEDLERYGYSWDFFSGKTGEDLFREALLRTVDLLRGLGEAGMRPELLDTALLALRELHGPVEELGEPLEAALTSAVEIMMIAFPEGAVACGTSKSATDGFKSSLQVLRQCRDRPGELARDWSLWQKLRKVKTSDSRNKTPPGFDEMAEAVITAADGLLRHPGPLQDACDHLSALIHGAQEAMVAYGEAKTRAGVIDYADMIAATEIMLRTQPEILDAVLAEIDCVVIDEFQDTNPVQFALLWRLAAASSRALIVGDTKQSIMGFQGADPRLTEALAASLSERLQPQDSNWRSDPRIMRLVNTIGPALFPDGYDPLDATRSETGLTALEILELPKTKRGNPLRGHYVVAAHIARLLADGEEVTDRKTGMRRCARPSDIAVLTFRRNKAADHATALRSLGLPVHIQGDGWRTSLPVMVAGHALTFAANPTDSHAALAFLTLGPARVPLEVALRNRISGQILDHAALAPLRIGGAAEMPLGALAVRVSSAAGLQDWAAGLQDGKQAIADLARFKAEASGFDMLAPEIRSAAGFYGNSAPVFLGWLAAQTERDFDRHPDPDGWSAPGVELVTWHAAKGREWPITIIADLDYDYGERGNSIRAEFDNFSDLGNVLDGAGLRFTPRFAAPECQDRHFAARISADENDACRMLYVALTRARDRLILAIPPAPREQKSTFADLLRSRCGMDHGHDGSGIHLCGQSFPASIMVAPTEMPPEFETEVCEVPDTFTLIGTPGQEAAVTRTPWRTTPSSLVIAGIGNAAARLSHVQLGTRVGGTPDEFDHATERGSAWHLAFRVLCSRADLADRLTAATGLDERTITAIGLQATAVRDWLSEQGYTRLHHELPIQVLHQDGSATNAVIDCLAEGPLGLMILDHKSGPAPDPNARFQNYRAQLDAYAEAVGAVMPTLPVRAVAINWMNVGVLSVLEFASGRAHTD